MARMNPLALWRLKRFCEWHDIDVQEIDDSVSYSENKTHLEGFLMRTPEELAYLYGRFPVPAERETIKQLKHKRWVRREPKQHWITISRTSIENVSFVGN